MSLYLQVVVRVGAQEALDLFDEQLVVGLLVHLHQLVDVERPDAELQGVVDAVAGLRVVDFPGEEDGHHQAVAATADGPHRVMDGPEAVADRTQPL